MGAAPDSRLPDTAPIVGSHAAAGARAGDRLTPLELPGWTEFNAWRTGLRVERFLAEPAGGGQIRAVLYVDRRGHVLIPPNNPYLPLVFESARQHPSGRTAEWFAAAEPLVDAMERHGVANAITFPPEVTDVRPWQWRRFLVGVRYTYYLDFPFDAALMDRSARRQASRATSLGLRVERTAGIDPVLECLTATEARQGFSHRVGGRELGAARSLLGDENLRMYVGYAADGRPASAMVVLHAPGARTIGWLAGTRADALASGVVHLVWRTAFDDLTAAGSTGIDLCGANIPSIAAFKSHWGARLLPFFTVRSYSLRAGARFIADWLGPGRRPHGPGVPGGAPHAPRESGEEGDT